LRDPSANTAGGIELDKKPVRQRAGGFFYERRSAPAFRFAASGLLFFIALAWY